MAGRKNIMLGTAGHVDHGKTALVKLLTGCETDILAEEKERGLTIDLGFAPCRLADERIVGVVDVPGHVDFIRNMVAGAHGVDVVILVVAADDGIMPQTREHLHILTLMGLRHGLVALTKIDLVEPGRRDEVVAELRGLLRDTFLAQASICPVSNVTGEGFGEFFDALNQVVAGCADRPDSGVFRVWVEDVFTLRGPGTVITGIPSSGRVRAGDDLFLLPAGRKGSVRRMQVYGEDANEGLAGECVALNVPAIDHLEVRRGMVLCASDTLPVVSIAEAELTLLESLRGTIEDFIEASLHVGTAAVRANVAMLEGTEMGPGQRQMVQLRLTEPLALAAGERFVLRANVARDGQSGLVTIGGGRILGTSNARLRRRKQWAIDLLTARREALDDPARWCEALLNEPAAPLTPADLQRSCLLTPAELSAVLDRLVSAGTVVRLGTGSFVHKAKLDQAADTLVQTIQAFHAANPQRAGMERPDLLSVSGLNAEVAGAAIDRLLNSKMLERTGTVLARAGWSARLSDPDRQLGERVAAAFQAAGFAGPAAGDLAAAWQLPVSKIERSVQLLCERGVLIRLDPKTAIHAGALDQAKLVVLRLFSKRPAFSTMDFRDAVAVSRKFAVPLLDYLDKIRYTVRNGHDRTPGVEARKHLAAGAPGPGAGPAA